MLNTKDLVRRVKDRNYHLQCFCCNFCKRELCTGEEIYILKGDVKNLLDANKPKHGNDSQTSQTETKNACGGNDDLSILCKVDYIKMMENSGNCKTDIKPSLASPGIPNSQPTQVNTSTTLDLPQYSSPSISRQPSEDSKLWNLNLANNVNQTGVKIS